MTQVTGKTERCKASSGPQTSAARLGGPEGSGSMSGEIRRDLHLVRVALAG